MHTICWRYHELSLDEAHISLNLLQGQLDPFSFTHCFDCRKTDTHTYIKITHGFTMLHFSRYSRVLLSLKLATVKRINWGWHKDLRHCGEKVSCKLDFSWSFLQIWWVIVQRWGFISEHIWVRNDLEVYVGKPSSKDPLLEQLRTIRFNDSLAFRNISENNTFSDILFESFTSSAAIYCLSGCSLERIDNSRLSREHSHQVSTQNPELYGLSFLSAQ